MNLNKKNHRFYHIPNKNKLIPGFIMLTLGIVFSLWAETQPADWLIQEQKVSSIPKETNTTSTSEPLPTDESPTEDYVMNQKRLDAGLLAQDQEILRASSLHMASVFPKGESSEDPSKSYGGLAFANLTEKDSHWISGIYGLSQVSPKELANRIGKKGSNLPEDWCKISVSFYDGDGTPISGYSNATEILSLASVYSYYCDPENGERFISYSEELWKRSHSYKISISDVYYCDGPCQFSDEKEEEFGDEELEAGSLEELTEESGGSVEVEIEIENSDSSVPAEPSKPIGPGAHNLTESTTDIQNETTAKAEETDGSESMESSQEMETVQETEPVQESANPDTAVLEETTSNSETLEAPTETAPMSMSSLAEAAGLSQEDLEALLKQSGPAGYTAYLESAASAGESSENETSGESASSETEKPHSEDQKTDSDEKATESSEKGPTSCNGHVDLHVTASIIGIDEKNRNLFSIDPIGNSENAKIETWNGWTWLPRLYAKSLENRDWYEDYGLAGSVSMYILNPLTASEIRHYMGMLPEGTSNSRMEVIRQALLSVGSIPYYWGGKPSAPGFENNGFGTITTPDQKGRTLRGLDCSGWINWVYWSALGNRLSAESTSGLSNCGREINRSELQPGDLIIRTGKGAHVYLFLSWASDGSMYVIHETGGITNNVTVSKTNVNWPYYRSLLN